jgi:hypothetical protein
VRVNNPPNRRSTTKKFKPPVSLKNQIRSAERMLRKVTSLPSSHDYHPNPNPNSIFSSFLELQNLPSEVREAQEQKLAALKKQQEIHTRLAVERKIFLRDRKIKFFERRKIERRIRRLEKLQRSSSSQDASASSDQLASLKQDLQYVTVYLSLFFK